MSLEAYKQECREAGTDKRHLREARKEVGRACDWLARAIHSYQASLFLGESPELIAEWQSVTAARRTLMDLGAVAPDSREDTTLNRPLDGQGDSYG